MALDSNYHLLFYTTKCNDDDDDESKNDIDDHIEDIKADMASITYISIVFDKRHGTEDGRTDRQSEL